MKHRLVVPDSNVLFGYLRTGQDSHLVDGTEDAVYLSAVVAKELRMGIVDAPSRRRFRRLVDSLGSLRRILVPSFATFERTGMVMQRMKQTGIAWETAGAFADVLIALSSKQIGATVVTRDRDFEAIRAIDPFKLELI